jgi:hypothetical protein
MVSPIISAPFSTQNSEDAVALREGGNATLKKNGRAVNAGEQEIKMPSFPVTLHLALTARA